MAKKKSKVFSVIVMVVSVLLTIGIVGVWNYFGYKIEYPWYFEKLSHSSSKRFNGKNS